MAGDFIDVSHLGNVYELVDKTLTVHLGQDAALVVVPATPQCYTNVTRHLLARRARTNWQKRTESMDCSWPENFERCNMKTSFKNNNN